MCMEEKVPNNANKTKILSYRQCLGVSVVYNSSVLFVHLTRCINILNDQQETSATNMPFLQRKTFLMQKCASMQYKVALMYST